MAFGLREKVRSVKHAIMVLGRQQLKRWVVLALYAGQDAEAVSSPLLELASVRGRLMELMVKQVPNLTGSDRECGDRAFIELGHASFQFLQARGKLVELGPRRRVGVFGALKRFHATLQGIQPLLILILRLCHRRHVIAQLDEIRMFGTSGNKESCSHHQPRSDESRDPLHYDYRDSFN